LLHNSEWVLLLLDGLEEQRPLCEVEISLRDLVKRHIANLLESRRIYWKQRNTIRWVKLGDENSKVFQAMASISHRKNSIASLTVPGGDIQVTNHEQKAGLLWANFKNRMGVSEFSNITYDLNNLLDRHDLRQIEGTFDDTDFEAVVKSIPLDHAPGPDGFNGKFIRHCWHIIKNDFQRLFKDFFNNSIYLTSINSPYIALIPKKDHPESVDDYRPISLLNCSVKCITKLLSIRLQTVITKLIHPNQYGFIKGRSIQDCLA